jgi:hypothetical protein
MSEMPNARIFNKKIQEHELSQPQVLSQLKTVGARRMTLKKSHT